MDCLVLTAGYEPHERITWQDAIVKIVKGAAEVLEWGADIIWTGLCEISGQLYEFIRKPSVIRLLNPFKRRKAIKFSRDNVFLRDKGRCQYCEQKVSRQDATLDHVLPRAQGGRTSWDNVVICCFPCNQKKRARTPEQAGMCLKIKPIRPKSLPLPKSPLIGMKDIPKEWVSYLYWNVELAE